MGIGTRIKNRRTQLGITQQELANTLQTTQAQIWKYEAGQSKPTSDVLITIAKTLDVSSDWILGLTDTMHPFEGFLSLTEKERDVIMSMRSKPAEKQQQIVDIVRAV